MSWNKAERCCCYDMTIYLKGVKLKLSISLGNTSDCEPTPSLKEGDGYLS